MRDQNRPAACEPRGHAIEQPHPANPNLGLDDAPEPFATAARQDQAGN
jgi:hypothetical protein